MLKETFFSVLKTMSGQTFDMFRFAKLSMAEHFGFAVDWSSKVNCVIQDEDLLKLDLEKIPRLRLSREEDYQTLIKIKDDLEKLRAFIRARDKNEKYKNADCVLIIIQPWNSYLIKVPMTGVASERPVERIYPTLNSIGIPKFDSVFSSVDSLSHEGLDIVLIGVSQRPYVEMVISKDRLVHAVLKLSISCNENTSGILGLGKTVSLDAEGVCPPFFAKTINEVIQSLLSTIVSYTFKQATDDKRIRISPMVEEVYAVDSIGEELIPQLVDFPTKPKD